MNQWIKKSEKIAVFYNDQSYSYTQLIEWATKTSNRITEDSQGVLFIEDKNPLEQLIVVIKGLLSGQAICFSAIEDYEEEEKSMLDDVFLIAQSSGTTGRKKNIYKKSNQWIESFQPYSESFGITYRDRLFINGSLEYTANLYSVLHLLYCGGSLVLSDDKKPKKWQQIIEKNSCSIAYMVPSKLTLLLKSIKEPWQYPIQITTAGEALSKNIGPLVKEKAPKMKVHHYYGAAELGHISAITHEELLLRPTSVGRAFKGVSVEIREGVIYGQSPYSRSDGRAYDSAFDYGYLDDEGYLYVKGRKDTQVNCNGRKFDALSIISALKEALQIEEILFISLKNKEGVSNTAYGLYVVLDALMDEDKCKNEIESFIFEKLERWQWPSKIKVVTNGIYSETGKYDMVRIESLFKA